MRGIFGSIVSVMMGLSLSVLVLGQDKPDKRAPIVFSQDKQRVIKPETRATPPPSRKPSPVKVQEGIKIPPKVKQDPQGDKKKPVTAFGIRPPTSNPDTEEKKPAPRFGVRPPASSSAFDEAVKSPGKSKKPSNNEMANKKSKSEESDKKSSKAEKAPPAEPQVNEPAPYVAPPRANVVTPVNSSFNNSADDPKFGSLRNAAPGTPVGTVGTETGFLNRAVTVGGTTYRYQVYIPPTWNRRQTWPVVLFLHGAGERGEDGILQTEVGIGTAIRRDVTRFPAIVVFPQCRKNAYWTEGAMQAQALAALEQSIREFNGDRARLYLTGISMGGFGTWGLAASHAGMFAAYAPVCGAIKGRDARMSVDVKAEDPYTVVARLVGQTPTWIFHGADDKTVLTEESRKMHDVIKGMSGNVQYTEYPGVGHNSWDKAYAEPKLMDWMLAQRLKK